MCEILNSSSINAINHSFSKKIKADKAADVMPGGHAKTLHYSIVHGRNSRNCSAKIIRTLRGVARRYGAGSVTVNIFICTIKFYFNREVECSLVTVTFTSSSKRPRYYQIVITYSLRNREIPEDLILSMTW